MYKMLKEVVTNNTFLVYDAWSTNVRAKNEKGGNTFQYLKDTGGLVTLKSISILTRSVFINQETITKIKRKTV